MTCVFVCDTRGHDAFYSREPVESAPIIVTNYGKEPLPIDWSERRDPASRRMLHFCPACTWKAKTLKK